MTLATTAYAAFDLQTPYLYVGTQYEVEKTRNFIYMNLKIESPCSRIDIGAIQPRHCELQDAAKPTEIPAPDVFGTYTICTHNHTTKIGAMMNCPCFLTVTKAGRDLGIKERQTYYDPDILTEMALTRTLCDQQWTQLLASTKQFLNTAIQTHEGQIMAVREPPLPEKPVLDPQAKTPNSIMYSNVQPSYPNNLPLSYFPPQIIFQPNINPPVLDNNVPGTSFGISKIKIPQQPQPVQQYPIQVIQPRPIQPQPPYQSIPANPNADGYHHKPEIPRYHPPAVDTTEAKKNGDTTTTTSPSGNDTESGESSSKTRKMLFEAQPGDEARDLTGHSSFGFSLKRELEPEPPVQKVPAAISSLGPNPIPTFPILLLLKKV